MKRYLVQKKPLSIREANQQALTQLANIQQQLDKLIQQMTTAKLTAAGLACDADKVNVSYDNQGQH
jgi:hypothetical protein